MHLMEGESAIPEKRSLEKHPKNERHPAWESESCKIPWARVRFPRKTITKQREMEASGLESLRFQGESRKLENIPKKLKQNSEGRKALQRLQFSTKGRRGQGRRRQIPLGFASLSAGPESSIPTIPRPALGLTNPRGVWRRRFWPFLALSPFLRKL